MNRDELTEALLNFIRSGLSSGDESRILDPAGIDLANRLRQCREPHDIWSYFAVGMLHWWRSRLLPVEESKIDAFTAIISFSLLLPLAPDLVPTEIRAMLIAAGVKPGEDTDLALGDARFLNHQAVQLLEDAQTSSDVVSLDRAIGLLRNAVESTSIDSIERVGYLSNLGLALNKRYERTGATADLEEAVEVGQQAVASTNHDSPRRAQYLSNLGITLANLYEHTGDLAHLTQAIECGRETLEATSIHDTARPDYMDNLANSLHRRFLHTDATADLDEVVEMSRQVIAAISADHPRRHAHLSNLSNKLGARYERTGASADLAEAVEVGRRAVEAIPAHHPNHAIELANFAGILLAKYLRDGALIDLNYAIDMDRAAIDAIPADHPDLARRLSNLGTVLETRYRHTGAILDINESVEVGWQAVAATKVGHSERAVRLSNLAGALRARYERTGSLTDLAEAVEVGRQAIAASRVDGLARARLLSNLSGLLQAQFGETGSSADLVEATEVARLAVEATPADHSDLHKRLFNLGGALHTLYEHTGNADYLADALSACKRSVAETPADHPDLARSLYGLATVTYSKYRTSTDKLVLRTAVGLYQDASKVSTASPMLRARSGRLWAELSAELGDWEGAHAGFEFVLQLLPQLVDHSLNATDRHHHLAQLQGLGSSAAHAALACRLPPPSGGLAQEAVEAAWVALEAGRGVLLSQALEARTDLTELRKAQAGLATRIEELQNHLSQDLMSVNLESPGSDIASAKRATVAGVARRQELAQAWDALMKLVRSTPGFERFGLPPTPQQLRAAAGSSDDGTIVAVNITGYGCNALLMTNHGSSYLPLPRLTRADAVDQASKLLTALYVSQGHHVDTKAMFEILSWLWDTVTEPVLHHLGHVQSPAAGAPWPRIWWIPTGALSVLPLHAAGHHDDTGSLRHRAVLDRAVSSYTPTVRALLQARERRYHRHQAHSRNALVVGIDHAPGQPELPGAGTEASIVHQLLNSGVMPLVGPQATHEVITGALRSAAWAHFACHAFADLDDPADSYLALFDKPLRVRELSAMDLPDAYLAYLSACTTATTSPRLLDESIHMASAFQLAGYAHTIATLWPVSDQAALRFARQVYPSLRSNVEPALAVHNAVHALRARYPRQPYAWASHVHFGP